MSAKRTSGRRVQLIVAADEPALLFASVAEAEQHIEAIDVARGVYPIAYGRAGEIYRVTSQDGRVRVMRDPDAPERPEELRALLLQVSQRRGLAGAADEPLEDLLDCIGVDLPAERPGSGSPPGLSVLRSDPPLLRALFLTLAGLATVLYLGLVAFGVMTNAISGTLGATGPKKLGGIIELTYALGLPVWLLALYFWVHCRRLVDWLIGVPVVILFLPIHFIVGLAIAHGSPLQFTLYVLVEAGAAVGLVAWHAGWTAKHAFGSGRS